jgi:maleate cis-trans isomerase
MTTTHRAGLLIPSSNTTIEYEFNRYGPAGLSFHAGRLTFTTISKDNLAAQDGEMLTEARKLATAHPDVLLICQSAVGFALGAAYEQDLAHRIQTATGIPVLSLASLMAKALHSLGTTRIALATPFPSGVDTATAAYLTATGLTVIRTVSLGLTGNATLAAIPPETLLTLAHQANSPEVQAIVIPGGNLPTLAILETLESALRKPVITTNQVALCALSQTLNLPPPPIGHLAKT